MSQLSQEPDTSATWVSFRDRSKRSAWHKVQEQSFQRWLNYRLEQGGEEPVENIFTDLADGTVLIKLLQILSGETVTRRYHKKPSHRAQKLANLSQAFDWMSGKSGKTPKTLRAKLINIGPEDIIDGNEELIMGLLWTIVSHYQITLFDGQQSNAKNELLQWTQTKVQPFGVQVNDFDQSWKDGKGFTALVANLNSNPNFFHEQTFTPENNSINNSNAWQVAEEELGIPNILSESMFEEDKPAAETSKCVMTYLSLFYDKYGSYEEAQSIRENSNALPVLPATSDLTDDNDSDLLRNAQDNHDNQNSESSQTIAAVQRKEEPSESESESEPEPAHDPTPEPVHESEPEPIKLEKEPEIESVEHDIEDQNSLRETNNDEPNIVAVISTEQKVEEEEPIDRDIKDQNNLQATDNDESNVAPTIEKVTEVEAEEPVETQKETSETSESQLQSQPIEINLEKSEPESIENQDSLAAAQINEKSKSDDEQNERGKEANFAKEIDLEDQEEPAVESKRVCCPEKSTAIGKGITPDPTSLKRVKFTVLSRDDQGELLKQGGNLCEVTIKGPKSSKKKAAVAQITDVGDGTYTVEYTLPEYGEYEIDVTLNGKPIAGGPFRKERKKKQKKSQRKIAASVPEVKTVGGVRSIVGPVSLAQLKKVQSTMNVNTPSPVDPPVEPKKDPSLKRTDKYYIQCSGSGIDGGKIGEELEIRVSFFSKEDNEKVDISKEISTNDIDALIVPLAVSRGASKLKINKQFDNGDVLLTFVPTNHGEHFIDIIMDKQSILPTAMQAYFIGDNSELSTGDQLFIYEKQITMGLGWDVTEGMSVDLDASCIMLRNFQKRDHVYFNERVSADGSVIHSGDNRTGKGEGDDEQIKVFLDKINRKINTLLFVVNFWDTDKNFSMVENAYVRLLDGKKKEMCKYTLSNYDKKNALIMARLQRYGRSKWLLTCIGETVDGGRVFNSLIRKEIIGKYLTKTLPMVSLTVKVIQGRNLPIADSCGTSDPYVIVYFDTDQAKSKTIKKNLNPVWNQTLRVRGQSRVVEIQVWDADKFSSDDFLGRVFIELPKTVKCNYLPRWYKLEDRKREGDVPVSGEILLSIKQD